MWATETALGGVADTVSVRGYHNARNGDHMRLSRLAKFLDGDSCDGFHSRVSGGVSTFLVSVPGGVLTFLVSTP